MKKEKNNKSIEQPKGRVLRVKTGYNPNSSSIGSGILPFLAFAAGAGVLSIILTNILEPVSKIIKQKQDRLKDGKPGDGE